VSRVLHLRVFVVVAVCALAAAGGSSPQAAVASQPAPSARPSYSGARPLAPSSEKAARPACRRYTRALAAAEVSLGTVEEFVDSFGPVRKAREDLAAGLLRLGISGSDGRLIRRFVSQLHANNALLIKAERTARGADFDTVLKAIAPFNRAAERESRFAKRLGLAGCA
jgi:hypothetical protein